MSDDRAGPADANSTIHAAPGPQQLEGKLCILAVVDRGYQRYLPTLACTALRAYPNCTVIVATDHRFRWRVRRILKPLLDVGDLRLMEHVFDDYPDACQEDLAVRRFLFDDPILQEFDYIYTPDSDMFICPETPTLVEQHVAQARQFNIPYSNVLRPTELPRLHGGHFVIREPYFRVMSPVLEHYRRQLREGKLPRRINDEHLLQRMVVEGGLTPPPPGTRFVGNHALHLGRWSSRFKRRRNQGKPAFTTPLEREHMAYYLRHKKNPAFAPALRLIRYELRQMEREYAEESRRPLPEVLPAAQAERSSARG